MAQHSMAQLHYLLSFGETVLGFGPLKIVGRVVETVSGVHQAFTVYYLELVLFRGLSLGSR